MVGAINGFTTTALFVLGPEMVDDFEKETVAFLNVLGLLGGIFVGSLTALFFTNLK
jgi:hypothetical protein